MARLVWTSVLLHFISLATCMTTNGRVGHGLIGYGIIMYEPNCATSCRAAISPSPLKCTQMSQGMEGMNMADMHGAETAPICYATDDAFLQTLAYCVSKKCADLPDWKKEKWWYNNVAGRNRVVTPPKESYLQTLERIKTDPTEVMVSGDPLNRTMLFNEDDWLASWNAQDQFEGQEITHEQNGLVVVLSGFIIPIAFSLLRFVPFPSTMATSFSAWVIDPPLWGKKHKQPLANLGLVPTRGQAIFISYLVILNILLSSVGYKSKLPNAWGDDSHRQIMVSFANRVGVLSFANLPLLILYSSRNNLLLKVTDWSHATFLLIHRWIAGIATVQAILHSLFYLQMYLEDHKHSTQSKLPFWYWGIIATLSMSILLPTSILAIRQKAYEIFLIWHIALSILTVAGCYYHIILRFEHQWGYETWLYVAIAVWGFDRIARLARMARNGIRRAIVTAVDEDYVRVDIPGVVASGHVYLYFPTLTWRVWENHPFSVAASVLPRPETRTSAGRDEEASITTSTRKDIHIKASPASAIDEKSPETAASNAPAALGLTFFLRTQSGLTSLLRSRTSLPVLIESSYGSHVSTSSHAHLVAIAGGVGITAVLPYIRSHPGSTKLFWGVRNDGIVESMRGLLSNVETEVFVGQRMVLRDVIEGEVAAAGGEGVTVVVSGPPSMADETRLIVSELGRKGARVTLVDEGFSW